MTEEMITPLSDFSMYLDNTKATDCGPNVVCANVADCRYGFEVVRLSPYKGELRLFDLNDQSLIHTEEVTISYNAQFGVCSVDQSIWKDKVLNILDETIKA